MEDDGVLMLFVLLKFRREMVKGMGKKKVKKKKINWSCEIRDIFIQLVIFVFEKLKVVQRMWNELFFEFLEGC